MDRVRRRSSMLLNLEEDSSANIANVPVAGTACLRTNSLPRMDQLRQLHLPVADRPSGNKQSDASMRNWSDQKNEPLHLGRVPGLATPSPVLEATHIRQQRGPTEVMELSNHASSHLSMQAAPSCHDCVTSPAAGIMACACT